MAEPAVGRTLLGVAGLPVSHSRSPAIHNAALAALGLDWLYVPVPLPADRFGETVRALPGSGFRGLNVTVPYKLAAHDLADERSAAAAAIGAANTLTFEEDAVHADNTDAPGLIDALGESPTGLRALVLGAGGAARAAVWALLDAGAAEVSVWSRTPDRAAALAAELGARNAERPAGADLLVNCTPVGLPGWPEGEEALTALGLGGADPPATVVDMAYGERPTALEEWAERGGARFVSGIEVLVRQGARSLERWTGRDPPVEVMRMAARG